MNVRNVYPRHDLDVCQCVQRVIHVWLLVTWAGLRLCCATEEPVSRLADLFLVALTLVL